VADVEVLLEGFPALAVVLGELDAHRPAHLGGVLQEAGLALEALALDVKGLVVGQHAEHLSHLHLLAQFDFQFLDFIGRGGLAGWSRHGSGRSQPLAIHVRLRRQHFDFRHELSRGHGLDLGPAQPTRQEILAMGLRGCRQPFQLVFEIDQLDLRHGAGLDERRDAVTFLRDQLGLLRALEQVRLSLVQVLADEPQREQRLPRFDRLPRIGVDLEHDRDSGRRHTAVGVPRPIDDHSRHLDAPPVRLEFHGPGNEPEILACLPA